MKKVYTLVVLLALTLGFVTGCDQGGSNAPAPADTNAPAAPASTNK